jgi:hypothetical protein
MAYPGAGQFSTFGYQNIYIPGYMGDDASQKRLMVGFTLNEEDFALNNYITVLGADKPKFYYMRWASADFVRVPHENGIDLRWADGADRPRAQENPRFTNELVELFRYGDQTTIGELTQEFSEIGPQIPIIQDSFASQFMVRRSLATQTELTTSGNYPTGHYYADWGDLANAAASLGYPVGYFGAAGTATGADGTINDPLFGKALAHGVKQILRRTNGRVKIQDLMMVMNPNTADRLKNTQEVRAYLAQQAGSLDVLKGKEPSMWPTFGLPNPFYGLKVLVDPTTVTLSKQDHTTVDNQTFLMDDGLVSIVARPGSVAGMPNSAPSGSLTLWQYKKYAMKPSTFPDPENRRLKVAFEDFFTVKLTCPEATFTIGDIFTATV